ncbi:MAG: VTT domain-containing protein [Cyclobacteriaceae bacterium]|nr:VTT domain-containing protein [Cyclobacteriaceae bacterium]
MKKTYSPKTADKAQFLLWNLVKGIIWLAILIVGYLMARKYLGFDLKEWMGPLYENSVAIYLIFLVSEVVFGIIPPEFFMFWSLRSEILQVYISNVAALATISYLAGIIGYYIGSYFNTTALFRLFKRRIFGKFERHFNTYGGFLVIVAALTPLPFAGICMLMGAVKYTFRKFVLISMMRFVRFIVYAIIIWEANIL